jgi:cation-transporting P-type ATPase 13A2
MVMRGHDTNISNAVSTDSRYLVPGDIFILDRNMIAPCDSILVSGEILVNESSLTGESLPIPKTSIQDLPPNDIFFYKTGKSSILYEGTQILKTKPK